MLPAIPISAGKECRMIFYVAYIAAGLTLASSVCLLLIARRGGHRQTCVPVQSVHDTSSAFRSTCGRATFCSGLVAAVILCLFVVVRVVYAVLEIRHGAPLPRTEGLGFPVDGLIVCGLLVCACGAGIRLTGDRRLFVVLFWLFILAGTWAALLISPYRTTMPEVVVRSPLAVWWALSLGVVLCLFVAAEGVSIKWWRGRLLRENPSALAEAATGWPLLAPSSAIVGVWLILLICFCFTMPVELEPGGYRLAWVVVAVAAFGSAVATLALVNRWWSKNLADVGLGLLTLAMCAAALCTLPSEPRALSVRFPMMFNALVFALAFAVWFWDWLAGVWEQQLDGGEAWTTAGRLRGRVWRLMFLRRLLGVLVAALMVFWPQLPKMPDADVSLGRLAFGVGAHLLLLLVLVRAGRIRHGGRHLSFVFLSGMAALSLIGFVITRAAAFTTISR